MSSPYEVHAANIICPAVNRIAVQTSSTVQKILTLSSSLQLDYYVKQGGFVTLVADGGDIYFHFANTLSVSATSLTAALVTGPGRAWLLKDGVPQSFRLTNDKKGLKTKVRHVCSAAAKKIRAYVSSSLISNDEQNSTQ